LSSCTVRPCGSFDFFRCDTDSDDDEDECIDMEPAVRDPFGSDGCAVNPDDGINEEILPEGTCDGSNGDGAPGWTSYETGGSTEPSTAPFRNAEIGGTAAVGPGYELSPALLTTGEGDGSSLA
jgi:hypothetical protein